MSDQQPPRIYCIPATEAPVAAVFRRGPTDWSHVGRWHLEEGRYEPGAWLRGRLYPRRSDLSPDGQYLCYFVHNPNTKWEHGQTYVALSRLPWLKALHAFGTCGTWTRGYCFTPDLRTGNPEETNLPIPYGLRSIPVIQFATERRRGWEESTDSPPRNTRDTWDQHRNARLQKRQPGGDHVLCVESRGRAGGEFGREQAVDGMWVSYHLETADDARPLDDVQWADWDRNGRLLAATRDGKLQIRQPGRDRDTVLFEADLSRMQPHPSPAPPWASQWQDH